MSVPRLAPCALIFRSRRFLPPFAETAIAQPTTVAAAECAHTNARRSIGIQSSLDHARHSGRARLRITTTDHVVQQTYSPNCDCWHGSHRRKLGGAVSGHWQYLVRSRVDQFAASDIGSASLRTRIMERRTPSLA